MKWKCFTRSAKKQQETKSQGSDESFQRNNLRKIKYKLAKKFFRNHEQIMRKQVFHALLIETKKRKIEKQERNLRLKFIMKALSYKEKTAVEKQVGKCFTSWKRRSLPALEPTEESRKNVLKRQQNSQSNKQINYRYSYNKTSLGSANHSRNVSRGPTAESKDAPSGANNKQPFQYAPVSRQLGANGQYRSASSLHSGSHKSLKAVGPGTTTSQQASNMLGVNQRYATRGQRTRYDNESYQDDEDEEEEAADNSYLLARTGNVSRESLGLPKCGQDNEAASRSVEMRPNHQQDDSLNNGADDPDQREFALIKNQTQAIKIENQKDSLDPLGIQAIKLLHGGNGMHTRHESSQSSEVNSSINKAVILTTPTDTNKGESNDSHRHRSSSELGADTRRSEDNDQLSKMRNQLKALQLEYQREQDKKVQLK